MDTLEQDLLANRAKLVATVADLVRRLAKLDAQSEELKKPPPKPKRMAGRPGKKL